MFGSRGGKDREIKETGNKIGSGVTVGRERERAKYSN
jgi:hypothetical protein